MPKQNFESELRFFLQTILTEMKRDIELSKNALRIEKQSS